MRRILCVLGLLVLAPELKAYSQEQVYKLIQHKVARVYSHVSGFLISGFFVEVPSGHQLPQGLYFTTSIDALGPTIDPSRQTIASAENIKFGRSIILESPHLGPRMPDGGYRRMELPFSKIYYSYGTSAVLIPISEELKKEFFPRVSYRDHVFELADEVLKGISPSSQSEVILMGWTSRWRGAKEYATPFAVRKIFKTIEKNNLVSHKGTRIDGSALLSAKTLSPEEIDTIKYYSFTMPDRALAFGFSGGPVLDSRGRVLAVTQWMDWENYELYRKKKYDFSDDWSKAPLGIYLSPYFAPILSHPKMLEIQHEAPKVRGLAGAAKAEDVLADFDTSLESLMGAGAQGGPDPQFQGEEGLKNNEVPKPIQ